jgi:putative Mn2+ efflux pump MntP
MINFPVALSVITIGVTSGLMSLLGFLLARTAINRMKIRTELLGGISLIIIALSLVLDKH